jgi:hypothetical protein
MADKSSAPSAEITSGKNTDIRDSFNTTIKIDASVKTEDVLEALRNNRRRLQDLKLEYAKLVQKDGGLNAKPSDKNKMIFNEIYRVWIAMEALKNELTARGAHYDMDVHDSENQYDAYKRLAKIKPLSFGILFWYIVFSAIILTLWLLNYL